MAILRWLYNALAIVGASVLAIVGCLVVVQVGTGLFQKTVAKPRVVQRPAAVVEPAVAERPMAGVTPAAVANPLPMPIGKARAQLVATNQRIFRKIGGYNVPQATFAWVERDGNDFLLVTNERQLLTRSNSTRELAVRLPDGRALRVQEHRLADSTRVAYVRFCNSPPDSLFVEYVPSDSLTPLRSERCPS